MIGRCEQDGRRAKSSDFDDEVPRERRVHDVLVPDRQCDDRKGGGSILAAAPIRVRV
jgi:hypothetical protein